MPHVRSLLRLATVIPALLAVTALLAIVACSKDQSSDDGHGSRHREQRNETGPAAQPAPASSPGDAKAVRRVAYYLTGHGAAAKGDPATNTVYGLGPDGTVLGSVISGQDPLVEPRGLLLLADGSLLVAASWKSSTHIARFGPPGADGRRPLQGSFAAQGEGNPAMVHTYAIAQAPDGSIYVSNQDTATVTRYAGPASTSPGTPLPPPASLEGLADLPAGLFAPSSKMSSDGIKDVRGIAFGPDGRLYVADRGGARVLVYDPETGALLRELSAEHHGFQHPIQPCFGSDPDALFVSDNGVGGVLRVTLSTGEVKRLISRDHGDLRTPGALLVVADTLLVGDRESRRILRFRLPDGERLPDLADDLPTAPEFLLLAAE